MSKTRQQLTLFLTEQNEVIEKIRATYNPIQFQLIATHVTLCREDEIENKAAIIQNINALNWTKPLTIYFEKVKRFSEGKGLLIPATKENITFKELRKAILGIDNPRNQEPHITLIHPRNATCTDSIFKEIEKEILPKKISFTTISLIEQFNDGEWEILEEYKITEKKK